MLRTSLSPLVLSISACLMLSGCQSNPATPHIKIPTEAQIFPTVKKQCYIKAGDDTRVALLCSTQQVNLYKRADIQARRNYNIVVKAVNGP